MIVKEIMDKNVVTMGPDVTVQKAAKKMVDEGTKFLIVTENEKLVGMVTEWDFVKKIAGEEEFKENAKLETIMTKKVIVVTPDTEIREAAEIMAENNIKKLPVVEKNVLIGVVTAMDVIAAEPKMIEQISELILTAGKQKPVAG
ncbi:MAG: CBS domain-containing protein [Candidatus Aenigmatarchaeota archaeon]|nr:MAG: CBS domain-containing protein [Candidatus Aenigmarchaeota archaeon]